MGLRRALAQTVTGNPFVSTGSIKMMDHLLQFEADEEPMLRRARPAQRFRSGFGREGKFSATLHPGGCHRHWHGGYVARTMH